MEIWKMIPIPKQGEITNIENYRPISLTCTSSRIFDNVLTKQIITYVENNNLIGSHPYVFRRGCSTVTQLIEVTHDIGLCIDSGGQVHVVFLDFVKALDPVPHRKLLHKYKYILNNEQFLAWLEADVIGKNSFTN